MFSHRPTTSLIVKQNYIDAVSGGVSPRREGAGDKICHMSDTVLLPPLLE